MTCDVKSLYTNIPHDEGIQSTLYWLNRYRYLLPSYTPSNNVLTEFMNFVLKHNYFKYQNVWYHQIMGGAMGSKMLPPFANLFMGKIEEDMFSNAPQNLLPLIWLRFIDDIFFLWVEGLKALKEFLDYINNFHPTIKYTWEYSTKSIHFLDTVVYVSENRKLCSNLFVKSIDRTMLLHQTSYHPKSCTRSIIYSQALRYRRLTTTDENLVKNLEHLKLILLARDYNPHLLTHSFPRSLNLPNNNLYLTITCLIMIVLLKNQKLSH